MAEEGIITYERLYEVLRLEKYKKELQRLDLDFYSKVIKYLDEKRAILQSQESKDSVFATDSIAKTKRQLENIKLILRELYEKREGKIIQMALFSSRTDEKLKEVDDLLEEEAKFYKTLVKIFNNYRDGIYENLLRGKLPGVAQEETEIKPLSNTERLTKTVKFLHPVPKFLGEDMAFYGPYGPEDIADLPAKVSEVLIKTNRAQEQQ